MFNHNLKKYRELKSFTQEKLANEVNRLLKTNYKKSSIYSWERNVSPNVEVIATIAEILDIPEQYLFDDSKETLNQIVSNEAPNLRSMVEHTKKVPLLNGYVGAGSSGVIERIEVNDFLYIDTSLIKKAYQKKEVLALTVIGDSMIPYVGNNDVVLYHPIEKGQYNFIDGKYVIETMNGVMIKNLCFKCNGDIVISSCNRTYSDEIIKCEETQEYLDIVGVAVGRLLKS